MKNKSYLISVLLALLIFSGLQFYSRGHFADPDGFYHAKVSQLLVAGDLNSNFSWLPLTSWASGFADQHYLYHLLLVPFNTAETLPVSVVLFALIFCAVFFALFKKLNISGTIWWTVLLLLGSVDFLFRINLVKANTLSLALMGATILLLLFWQQKKSALSAILLAAVGFIFVWTYGGFVFMPLLVGAYTLAILIYYKKLDYLPVVATAAGIGLGLLLHPHQSNLLESLSNQLFQTGLGAGSRVPAGNEWIAYDLAWFIKSNIVVLFAWMFSLVITARKLIDKTLDWKTFWLQLIALAFFVLALRHRRFIEYFVPFVVLAIAVTLSPFLENLRWQNIKDAWLKVWQFRFAASLVSAAIIVCLGWNLHQVAGFLKGGAESNEFKGAAEAIAANSEPGDMVLNTQWDQFPALWYWNSKNNYMAGMDPTFLYIQNPEKYWDWRLVADDEPAQWQSVEHLHSIISNSFNAKYILVDTDRNPDIQEFIMSNDLEDKWFKEIYNDRGIIVMQVLVK